MKSNILFGIGGLVLGILGGVFGAKKYYENKYNSLYEENLELMKSRYSDFSDQIEEDPVPEDGEYPHITAEMTPEEKAERKKQIRENSRKGNGPVEKLVDYTKFYEKNKASAETDPNVWHKMHENDPPSIISDSQESEYPEFIERRRVTFYHYDDTLLDEDEDTVINFTETEFLFGSCLDDFYDGTDEKIIVLSPQVDCIYTVTREMASYYADYDNENE